MSLSNDALAVLKRHHPAPLRLGEIRQRMGSPSGHPKSLGVALQRLHKNGNVKRAGRLWQYVSDNGAQVRTTPDGLDIGIAPFVTILALNGIETFESCEGGKGHAFPEPTIRFHGSAWAGFRAFSVAMEHGLPVLAVRLSYHEQDGQLAGPHWEIVFRQKAASGDTLPKGGDGTKIAAPSVTSGAVGGVGNADGIETPNPSSSPAAGR